MPRRGKLFVEIYTNGTLAPAERPDSIKPRVGEELFINLIKADGTKAST